MLSRVRDASVVLLVLVVAGATAWAYADWRERVQRQVARSGSAAVAAPPAAAPSVEPSAPAPAAPEVVSLWVGDGYTAGYACATAALLDWTCEVQAEEGVGFVNATSGETLLERLDDLPAVDPDVVVVDAGRNDVRLVDAPNLRSAVDAYLDALRTRFPDARLVQVVPWTLSQGAPPAVDVAAVVDEVARAHDGEVVDPVADGWAGAGSTDGAELRDPAGGLSEAGDRYVAERLAAALAPPG